MIKPGADRENTTVLAACSADVKFLPPMVVFSGQFVQTTWKHDLPADAPNYPKVYANSSGWMDSPTFYKWFIEFEQNTRHLNAS